MKSINQSIFNVNRFFSNKKNRKNTNTDFIQQLKHKIRTAPTELLRVSYILQLYNLSHRLQAIDIAHQTRPPFTAINHNKQKNFTSTYSRYTPLKINYINAHSKKYIIDFQTMQHLGHAELNNQNCEIFLLCGKEYFIYLFFAYNYQYVEHKNHQNKTPFTEPRADYYLTELIAANDYEIASLQQKKGLVFFTHAQKKTILKIANQKFYKSEEII